MAKEINEDAKETTNTSQNVLELIEIILKKTSQVEQVSKVLSNSSENLNEIVRSFKI